MNPYSEERRTLAMAFDALSDPIANADGWYQLHLIDVRERLYGLWDEAKDREAAMGERETPSRG